ncbi:MORC family CW-type zinc finger protein 3-like [Olea europaea var. sylvestris]|uniref:MORC family CW-type zinc finger protein 3-like n=1 Tax=Olea europaea var. sylvestris TaxID=158386 RepID=UPI000C1D0851|nr:MORC family CW-type zinc finger protein 3-like [Olea europaea var. sylvestris]
MRGILMEDSSLKKEFSNEDMLECYVLLTKDKKIISRTVCRRPHNLPNEIPLIWDISSFVRRDKTNSLSGLPCLLLCPGYENAHQEREWGLFLNFLRKYNKVAISKLGFYEIYILPPDKNSEFDTGAVICKMEKVPNEYSSQRHVGWEINAAEIASLRRCMDYNDEACRPMHPSIQSKKNSVQVMHARPIGEDHSPDMMVKDSSRPGNSVGCGRSSGRNYAIAHPSYLKTLGQAHSGWIFGAIAELVDNSRDAKATKLEISIDMLYSKTAGKDIPMLSIIDDGHGMSHQEIVRMISFGHVQPEADDPDHIGRFGIGFKTGAMRLGKDALVLTQTANSRSIAFLSQSLNEGKDNLEIPVVSYRRIGQFMEVDTSVQNESSAKYNLKVIKEFSPFDKYLIGEKAGLFSGNSTGTQIFIWNLDVWGSNYSLQWEAGMSGGSSFHQGDILIRSRRIRSRPGQISQKVPLDYSLRSYLEVIFFDPRMKIYVQGARVKCRPLAKSLNNTIIENGIVMGKPVQLTLGRSQLEWEQANCGMFLYWHGRLIEAYKRVGSMVHNGDNGRGIVGVVDVTDLIDDGKGHVWVHNSKQGFQDCEAYAELEKWLGERADEYLDKFVDTIQLRGRQRVAGMPLRSPLPQSAAAVNAGDCTGSCCRNGSSCNCSSAKVALLQRQLRATAATINAALAAAAAA